MLYPRFCSYLFLLLTSLSLPTTLQSKISTPTPDPSLSIASIQNRDLKKGVRKVQKGQQLKENRANQLLKLAMKEEAKVSFPLVSYLIDLYKKNKIRFNKDEAMKDAIRDNASIEVITFFLKNQIYSPKALEGEVRYDLIPHSPIFRIGLEEILKGVMIPPEIIPESIQYPLDVIFKIIILLGFLRLIRITKFFPEPIRNCEAAFVRYGEIWSKIMIAFNIIKLFYYKKYKIGKKPGYLLIVLLSKIPKEKKEKLALLFLEHGANSNQEGLLINPIDDTASTPEAFFLCPCSYEFISPIHLAAKYDCLELVKELVKRGVNLEVKAVYMEDVIPKDLISFYELVSFGNLYFKKYKSATYKSAKEFANPESETYKYLLKKSLEKPTKASQPHKKDISSADKTP